MCWDNFDLTEETPSGAGTTHTAHGIVIQEMFTSADSDACSDQQSLPKDKKRSVTVVPHVIEPYYIKKRAEPNLTVSNTVVEETSSEKLAKFSDILWILTRFCSSSSEQTVPGWAGWITLTSSDNHDTKRQSTVDYMAPVNSPITENATIQHIIKLSQAASREMQQQYTVLTFDLGVAKKAYEILWQNPNIFSDVLVRMGVFYITCSYLGALGKPLCCSGFEEILVESGICASGSINKVMSGKHYNRAMRVHKLTLEALERLLLKTFEEVHGLDCASEVKDVLDMAISNPSQDVVNQAMENRNYENLFDLYESFKEKVHSGDFWQNTEILDGLYG